MKTIDEYFRHSFKDTTNISQSIVNKNEAIYVYTDGSCVHNGKPHARAGIGVYFADGDTRNVSRRVLGKQTNNTAELSAILEVKRILKNQIEHQQTLYIYTDSQYSILCATTYGQRMSRQGYQDKNKKTNQLQDIPNKYLVKELYEWISKSPNIKLVKIEAHTGKQDRHSLGNEQADRLANMALYPDGKIPISKNRNKVYLNIPFHLKDQVKSQGAKWDFRKKKWYYWSDLDIEKIENIRAISL